MKVQELRQLLNSADRVCLEKALLECYKQLKKDQKEDFDPSLTDILTGKMTEKKKVEKKVDFADLEESKGYEDDPGLSAHAAGGGISVYLVSGHVESFPDSLLVYLSGTVGDVIWGIDVYCQYFARKAEKIENASALTFDQCRRFLRTRSISF